MDLHWNLVSDQMTGRARAKDSGIRSGTLVGWAPLRVIEAKLAR